MVAFSDVIAVRLRQIGTDGQLGWNNRENIRIACNNEILDLVNFGLGDEVTKHVVNEGPKLLNGECRGNKVP